MELTVKTGWTKEKHRNYMRSYMRNLRKSKPKKRKSERFKTYKKLIALSRSSNEYEADLARKKADEIETKYFGGFLLAARKGSKKNKDYLQELESLCFVIRDPQYLCTGVKK